MSDPIVMHTVCPHCLREHDLAGGLNEDAYEPHPGALSLCILCGKFSVFQDDLSLRRPTREEQQEFDQDPWLIRAKLAWMEATGR